MKGVVLAGGSGARLAPLTAVTNKHLLPVGRKPMICYPIDRLVDVGAHDILVVTGTEHAGAIFQFLGSGKEFGCRFTFRVQDRAGGIAEAIGLAREFAGGDPFCAILGDNIFTASLRPFAVAFTAQHSVTRGMILLSKTKTPERFGIAALDGDRITRIVEKPTEPISDAAIIGVYFFCGSTVFDLIDGLAPSGRGELEVTDLHRALLERGRLSFEWLPGPWTDAGTHETLAVAGQIIGAA